MSGCKVYSQDLLSDILSDTHEELFDTSTVSKKRSSKQSKGSKKSLDRAEEMKVLRNKAYWRRMNQQQAESERKVREQLEVVRKNREKRFESMCKAIEDGETYAQKVDKMLELHEQMEYRKKVTRYNEWNDNVYNKIQNNIKETIEKNAGAIRKIRAKEYEKFLQETNEKSSLFLDIVIPSSYDPFVVNKSGVKASVGKLDDPLKRVFKKADAEKSMIPGRTIEQSPSSSSSRGTLSVQMWASGKIESTPHGFFAKMMETSATTSPRNHEQYETNFNLDHFNFPVGKEAIDREFPKGKKTFKSSTRSSQITL